MKSKFWKILPGLPLLLLLPLFSTAQDITSSLQGMQPVLNNVYDQMIPMCSNLI
ncbi:MAG: conjugative transposon protein TraJ, partial [Bacteroidetes bacterium]|nr:conjugative transposon protein TraJ [Bacteroidota bacterium]